MTDNKLAKLRAQIQDVCDQFGFKITNDEVDLREYPNEGVFRFFYALKDLGTLLFHGTNSAERFSILEARQANDGAKESGNKKAVYADAGITIPAASAVFDMSYIKNKFDSFVTSWGNDPNGKMFFNFSKNVYELFKAHDPYLFSDGYIYILDKSKFLNAEDAGAEWHSESDQIPFLACRVSKNLASDLFIIGSADKDNVSEYSG